MGSNSDPLLAIRDVAANARDGGEVSEWLLRPDIFRYLCAYAKRHLPACCQNDNEDAAQLFISANVAAVWSSWRAAGAKAPFDGYFRTSFKRLCWKWCRHTDLLTLAAPASTTGDQHRVVAGKEIGKLLASAIRELPNDLRAVFIATVIEERTGAEVATLLDISPGNVRVRLLRARQALRDRLFGLVSRLTPGQICDGTGLCRKLTRAGAIPAPSPERRFWDLLEKDDRDAVATVSFTGVFDQSKETRILDALNIVISRSDCFDERYFGPLLTTSDGALKKLAADIDGKGWLRYKLNRTLFDLTFTPHVIAVVWPDAGVL